MENRKTLLIEYKWDIRLSLWETWLFKYVYWNNKSYTFYQWYDGQYYILEIGRHDMHMYINYIDKDGMPTNIIRDFFLKRLRRISKEELLMYALVKYKDAWLLVNSIKEEQLSLLMMLKDAGLKLPEWTGKAILWNSDTQKL